MLQQTQLMLQGAKETAATGMVGHNTDGHGNSKGAHCGLRRFLKGAAAFGAVVGALAWAGSRSSS